MAQSMLYRRPAPEKPAMILDACGGAINDSHIPLFQRAGGVQVLLSPTSFRRCLPDPIARYEQVSYRGLLWRQLRGLPDHVGLVLGPDESLVALIVGMGDER